MRRFFKQIVVFFLVFGLIFLIGIFLPVTPGAKNNMLSYKVQKDSLLHYVPSPRIIFIGGSNLVFGLNSQMIKDSLQINPINNGMAASIGLIYMMDDVLPHIKPGDYVVIAPEYQNFYGSFAYGGHDLFRVLVDVERSGFKKLRPGHLPNLIKALPTYFTTKFRIRSYFYDGENDIYGKHIFNKYGDSEFHWKLKKRNFPTIHPINGAFNHELVDKIVEFNRIINNRGAKCIITFPCLQEDSLSILREQAEKIKLELERAGLIVLGSPQRYSFPDSLMFDQVYHLNKGGVDLRTQYLIEDINKKGKENF